MRSDYIQRGGPLIAALGLVPRLRYCPSRAENRVSEVREGARDRWSCDLYLTYQHWQNSLFGENGPYRKVKHRILFTCRTTVRKSRCHQNPSKEKGKTRDMSCTCMTYQLSWLAKSSSLPPTPSLTRRSRNKLSAADR